MKKVKWKDQEPEDRVTALELTNQWLAEVCKHIADWEATDPSDSLRKAVHTLIKRIYQSCKAVGDLTRIEQYEQAGAMLRVAIENLWLVDLFGSDHHRVAETMMDWINGEKMKPSLVRRMIAEEFGEGDASKTNSHREFLDAVYGELCSFIHPQATQPAASILERGLLVVFVSILGCTPVFLSKFDVKIPPELSSRVDLLIALVVVLLTNHLPGELREIAADFAAANIAPVAEIN